jgi:eukaryotic-like serine/threonine-protein kinase
MAPEQAGGKGKEVGPAADVYALGAILYELLTGRPPFKAETPLDTVLQVLHDEPVPPSRLHPRLARDLETICLKCLEKEPRKRYAFALALADDLRRFRKHEPIRARPTPFWERTWKWARRRPAVATLAVLLVLSIGVGLALVTRLWLRAEGQRGFAEQQRREAQQLAVRLAIDRGVALCEQGNSDEGMLWLAAALERLPADAPRLEHSVRALMAAWRPRWHLLRTVFSHGDAMTAAAFSPDGRWLVTGSNDRTARLWETSTGRQLAELPHRDEVLAVAFSPDGRTVLTGSGSPDGQRGEARLWDAATGEPKGEPLAHGRPVAGVAFSPDGARFVTRSDHPLAERGGPVAGEKGEARLWEAASGRPFGGRLAHRGRVRVAVFSPDGRRLLTGGGDTIARLWEAATGRLLGEAPHPEGIMAAAFTPDGRHFAAACWEDGQGVGTNRLGKLLLWQTAAGQLNPEPFLLGGIRSFAFSPDGKTLLVGGGIEGGTAQLYDVGTWTHRGEPLVFDNPPGEVAFSPDGGAFLIVSRADSSTGGREVGLFEAGLGKPLGRPLVHPAEVVGAAFGQDGKTVLTWGTDGLARLWRIAPEEPADLVLPPPPLRNAATVLRPDGKVLLTVDPEGTGRLCGMWVQERPSASPLGSESWRMPGQPSSRGTARSC